MERDDLSKLDWAAGVLEGMVACYIQADQKPLADKLIDDADKKTGNGDRDLTFAKSKRDEAIRKIVGDEMFVPFDRDYGSAYIDELRRIRIMGGRDGDGKTT